MTDIWARYIEPSGQPGPDYWIYFAERLADLATIPEGAAVLDIGTYDGNVLFKAMKKAGARGFGVGIDIYDRHLPEHVKATGKSISSYEKENPEGYEVVLRSSGFHNISLHVETTTFVSPDAATWWRQMKHAAREYFEQVPDPDKLERFKEEVFADLQQSRSPDGIHFSKTVSFTFGTKFRRKAIFL